MLVKPSLAISVSTRSWVISVHSDRLARAVAKRRPQFKGWNDPADRYRLPKVDAAKG
jgi:hypothetical protein